LSARADNTHWSTDGAKLASSLRKLAVADNPAVVHQVVESAGELSATEANIIMAEQGLDALIDDLYGLSDADVQIIRRAGPPSFFA
jgi:hypothetical protein